MKRFTDTEKWRDPWYRELPPRLKCLWQFFCDTCDHAGVFKIDWKLASFEIGERVTERDLDVFGDRLQVLPSGRYLIKKYIPFQSGNLSESCPAHKPIIKLVQTHGLTQTTIGYQYPIARVSDWIAYGYPIAYPIARVQEIEKDRKGSEEGGLGETMRIPPDPLDAINYGKSIGMLEDDVNAFMDHHQGSGWRLKAGKMKDWKAALRTWNRNGKKFNGLNGHSGGVLRPIDKSILQKEKDLIIASLTKIRNQYDGHQSWSEADKKEAARLKPRLAIINNQLGCLL